MELLYLVFDFQNWFLEAYVYGKFACSCSDNDPHCDANVGLGNSKKFRVEYLEISLQLYMKNVKGNQVWKLESR